MENSSQAGRAMTQQEAELIDRIRAKQRAEAGNLQQVGLGTVNESVGYTPEKALESIRQQQAYYQQKPAVDQAEPPDSVATVLFRINSLVDESREGARTLLNALQGSNGPKEEDGRIPSQGLIGFLQSIEEKLIETKRFQYDIALIIN